MTVYRYFKLANISWPLNKRQNNNLNELRQFSQRMANQNVFYLSRLQGSHVGEEAKGTCSAKQFPRWVCHSATIGPPTCSQQEPIQTLHLSLPKCSFKASFANINNGLVCLSGLLDYKPHAYITTQLYF